MASADVFDIDDAQARFKELAAGLGEYMLWPGLLGHAEVLPEQRSDEDRRQGLAERRRATSMGIGRVLVEDRNDRRRDPHKADRRRGFDRRHQRLAQR